MQDRSRPAFVYVQSVTGGGGKATKGTNRWAALFLDFLKVEICPRTLEARVSRHSSFKDFEFFSLCITGLRLSLKGNEILWHMCLKVFGG